MNWVKFVGQIWDTHELGEIQDTHGLILCMSQYSPRNLWVSQITRPNYPKFMGVPNYGHELDKAKSLPSNPILGILTP